MEPVGGSEVKETEMSKVGHYFSACHGSKLKDKGCMVLGGSEDSAKVRFVSQIGNE